MLASPRAAWIAVGALIGLMALPATAGATFPGDNGLIAFQDDGSGGIYTIRPDGSDRTRVDGDGWEPSWSANGRRIAFVKHAGPGGDTDVFTMKPNGSDKQPITRTRRWEWEPAFSPNGQRIVYRVGDFRGGDGKLHVVDIDGSHREKLGKGEEPDWSPNGRRIAFANFPAPSPCSATEVFTMKPSGGRRTLLPFGCNTSAGPSWSPDGSQLAIGSYPPVGNRDIYIGPKDGSSRTQLTNLANQDENPSWSPDGTQIVFGDEDNGLYRVTVSSPLTETAIPNTADVDGDDPAWQPVSH